MARCLEMRRKELHELERPTALGIAMQANIHRDVKKRKQPYEMSDYCVYGEATDERVPSGTIGAAAIRLLSMNLLPNWALFAYKDLAKAAQNGIPPELLALICDDAILLAPQADTGGYYGMLIALESASGQIREVTSPCGKSHQVIIPKLASKVSATEDAFLKVIS